MPSRHRWEFLLRTPKRVERRINRIAQATLDDQRRWAFPSAIRYPITVARTGEEFHTLPRYLESSWWSLLRAETLLTRTRCEGCSTEHELDILHRSHRTIGTEAPEDLLVLCPRCREVYLQQLRTGRRYGWKVQRLSTCITFTKPQLRRTFRHGGIPAAVPSEPTAKQPTSSQLKVHGRRSPRMGAAPSELLLVFIDDEPVFLDVLDV
jgi:hypothetical protein